MGSSMEAHVEPPHSGCAYSVWCRGWAAVGRASANLRSRPNSVADHGPIHLKHGSKWQVISHYGLRMQVEVHHRVHGGAVRFQPASRGDHGSLDESTSCYFGRVNIEGVSKGQQEAGRAAGA